MAMITKLFKNQRTMKRLKNISILTVLAAIAFAGIFSSCKDETEVQVLPRVFRPVNFNASTAGITATINWASVDSAVSYTLQIGTDSTFATIQIDTTTTSTSFVTDLSGATTYYARIRANASNSVKDSKFNETLSFSTPKENLFNGYTINLAGLNTIDVKWLPNASVTKLVLTDANNASTTVSISANEASAGEKIITNLPNSAYSIQILKNAILRGTSSIVVEGDVLVNSGDDLPTAIANASAGQVLLLAPGVVYPMGTSTLRFGKDIKIRGLNTANKPVLCMTSGSTTTTSSMLGFADGSTMNYVKFENIDFTGYCDNSTTSTKIGYLFNNNVMTTLGSLSFKNCNMHNFGNTPMRIQGNKNQVIDTLTFNSCVINEIGFSSTYAVVNSNSADIFNNINFINCTVYNFKGSLILRQNQTLNSINVSNCTINQGMLDPGSARYLIDTNNATVAGSITIQSCIFGQTGAAKGANGVRTTGTLTIARSYYTTDYVDDPIPVGTSSSSIKPNMTSYAGASAALWIDPVNGNFKLKDNTFVGKGIAGSLLQ
jgi:hypothetical protein